MRRYVTAWVVVACVLSAGGRELLAEYKADAPLGAVATVEAEWKDAVRGVVVPVKIYCPKGLAERKEGVPLVIFSHGLGGSREGYVPWVEAWAGRGYVVVMPTHVGSDTSVLGGSGGAEEANGAAEGKAGARGGVGRGALQNLKDAANLQNARRRVDDVSFVIDQMEKANAGTLAEKEMAVFKERVDVKHIGMAGHSFGAQTTMAIAGQTFVAMANMHGDPRVTAAVAMSPSGAFFGGQEAAFASVKIPVFHITGTADDNPMGMGNVKAADRRVVFDHSPAGPGADTYLVIYKGATHMTFAPMKGGATPGQRLRELISSRNAGEAPNTPEQEARIHALVAESTGAFWDAYLKGDAGAKAWLRGEFAKELGKDGTFEMK